MRADSHKALPGRLPNPVRKPAGVTVIPSACTGDTSMIEKDRVPQSYWDNLRWAREHSTELHEQYEDVWIAIVDQQVVASASNMMRAKKLAAQKTGRPPEEISVKFIDSGITI
jgi:hypothetical protein